MTSPMQRNLAEIKKTDKLYQIVEYYHAHARKSFDLFNIIDLLVLGSDTLGIQVCGKDFASHKTKIMVEHRDKTTAWLKAGNRLEVWGWRRLKKKRGGKAMFWSPRIAVVTLQARGIAWFEIVREPLFE